MSPKLLANDIIHEIESIDGLISTDIHQIDFWYQQFRKNIISDNGRPIEEVQMMLGHEQIDTTLIYAKVSKRNVKSSHEKYM